MQNRPFCIHLPPNRPTCMQNVAFCIHLPPNRRTCMQNRPFCIHLPPNSRACMQNRAFCIHPPPNHPTCMQNRLFCIQNASLCMRRGWRQMIQRGRQKAAGSGYSRRTSQPEMRSPYSMKRTSRVLPLAASVT